MRGDAMTPPFELLVTLAVVLLMFWGLRDLL